MSITEVDGLVAQSIEASVALVRQGKQIDSDGGGAVDIAALSRLGEVAGAAASGVDIKFSIESAFRDRLCSVLVSRGRDQFLMSRAMSAQTFVGDTLSIMGLWTLPFPLCTMVCRLDPGIADGRPL